MRKHVKSYILRNIQNIKAFLEKSIFEKLISRGSAHLRTSLTPQSVGKEPDLIGKIRERTIVNGNREKSGREVKKVPFFAIFDFRRPVLGAQAARGNFIRPFWSVINMLQNKKKIGSEFCLWFEIIHFWGIQFFGRKWAKMAIFKKTYENIRLYVRYIEML